MPEMTTDATAESPPSTGDGVRVGDEMVTAPREPVGEEPSDAAAEPEQPAAEVAEEPEAEELAAEAFTAADEPAAEDTELASTEPVEPAEADVMEIPEAEGAAPEVEEAAAIEVVPEPEPVRAVEAAPEAGDQAAVEVVATDDPFRGPGDWYVVHTYAGYENKVKANLESRIHTMQMEGKIFRVHIPMEDVMEIKSGKKQVVQKKVFPGYLLVKMLYDNDSWYVVRNTPGVTGFVSAGTGTKPTPLSRREVEKILAVKKEEVKPQFRLGFEEHDVVRIISGPFADFNGTISEINVDQSKLKVLVNIFDRETPVELGFDQVSKV
jgi:transcriptional antiterminator NusG